MPRAVILNRNLGGESQISHPIILKIPTGLFARHHKADNRFQRFDELLRRSESFWQEFMYTNSIGE